MFRLAACALLFVLAQGCGAAAAGRSCSDDSQCGEGQVCFPDGCGDPTENIAVEVVPNNRIGRHAQDLLLPELRSTTQDLTVEGGQLTSLGGEIQRASTRFTSKVTIRADGESELIPGLTRRFEYTFQSLESGAYTLGVAAGKYQVTATATEDRSIPPASTPAKVSVPPGKQTTVSFTFESEQSAVALVGRLVKRYVAGSPPLITPVTQAEMELQAIDPLTRRALSQRVPVSSGPDVGSPGDFTLFVSSQVKSGEPFYLLASPRQAGAPVPSKTFLISPPFSQSYLLELGDFGALLQISGKVVASDGAPVPGASVEVEGKVRGGGTFKSALAITDLEGKFRLKALAPEQSYTLTVIPPPSAPRAGIFHGPIKVSSTLNVENAFEIEPRSVVCPDRIAIRGRLLQPENDQPAYQVPFTAVPTQPVDDWPLPPMPLESLTDEEGRFALHLDPAVYRLDFVPSGELPRRSRVVTVRSGDGKSLQPLELGELKLYRGRRVSGTVSMREPGAMLSAAAVPTAQLRFFWVRLADGKPSATLLGQALADEKGHYSVVLPAP